MTIFGRNILSVNNVGYAVAQLVEALRYKPEGRVVRFPMGSLEFFSDPIGRIVAVGSTQPLTEMSSRDPSWG
jgi:hypothetical protein